MKSNPYRQNQKDDVYEYIVCWQEDCCDWDWKHKVFAKKKEAKAFAKKKKNKKNKPYPYIIQKITSRTTFRSDVEVEVVKKKHKNTFDRFMYRKIIKY